MSSSLKQEALRARKGKFKQITIKHICKGEILSNLDYIHKVYNHKVKATVISSSPAKHVMVTPCVLYGNCWFISPVNMV